MPGRSNSLDPRFDNLTFGGGVGPGNSAIFGGKVGATPIPYGPNLSDVYPNLSGTNAAASSGLVSELTGQLSPHTVNSIQNAMATYGINSGMPGSQMVEYKFPRDIGLASEQLIHQGIGDYGSLIPAVAQTQTVNPNTLAPLQAEIDAMNKVNAAAPNPAAAGSYAQELFDKYLKSMSSPAGGTGGSGGVPWYAQGHAGQAYVTPGVAGGWRGDTTPGSFGGSWG